METVEIAVVGAGVVGLTIAHRLAADGHEVMLIDHAPPGAGASYGNAGTIANYAVQPVGTPDVLRALPSLLFNRTSPLAILPKALPTLAPWLLRFARHSLPGAARANALALAGLLADAGERWTELANGIGAADLIQDRGSLYWYQTDQALSHAKADIRFRQSLGVRVELVSAAELQALEPDLPVFGGGGAFFPDARFITDPGAMMAQLSKAVLAHGATLRAARVTGLTRGSGAVRLSGTGLTLAARRVVLAAGAHSRELARMAGDRIPLDTERGYHLEWDMPAPRLTRPVCPTTQGFYLCPMQGRLRVAGTVEMGGLYAPPSAHRLTTLETGARAIFPDLAAPVRSWMGFRPSLPDSLPVIGPSRAGAEVIHAFGHGHIGLTLAPVTAELVARCISGHPDDARLSTVRPDRF